MPSDPKLDSLQGLKNEGIEIKAPLSPEYLEILSADALRFLAELARKFEPVRQDLLKRRRLRQQELDAGKMPDFLPETRKVREGDWKGPGIPKDLEQRTVEITGPADRKMIVNALNSGANVFMADFEDSNTPTWSNNIEGQIHLKSAVNRSLAFTSPEGKHYELSPVTATLMVRPRGWHLSEKHMTVDGAPISASLFDFGLYFFHNVHHLIERGTGPYFYLPKMESHLEARLWNDVFVFAQDKLSIPRGTIRATVLIETILAAFEMDEILYELREHSAGLNCGRWDYIFSFIKKFRAQSGFVLPDRIQITMDRAFLKAYVELLIKTCHRRGVHAMGGMAAQIPIKSDPSANQAALEKVRLDKLREVRAGHDGTWVAHPGLISVARTAFEQHMKGPNQLGVKREDVVINAKDLLSLPEGEITENGLRKNINVGILYLEAWLRGTGCVPLYNLMEDAATAEISRTQVWQWIHHNACMADGKFVTPDLVRTLLLEEVAGIRKSLGDEKFEKGKYALAAQLFEDMATSKECPEFLTLVAYDYLD
ncbi:MAG TPA: malate synthase A [Verrucomicrobiae bacterium]|jgi:malate synthase|nr:malate synthase A [Verrucomicrobiae bacterium]